MQTLTTITCPACNGTGDDPIFNWIDGDIEASRIDMKAACLLCDGAGDLRPEEAELWGEWLSAAAAHDSTAAAYTALAARAFELSETSRG